MPDSWTRLSGDELERCACCPQSQSSLEILRRNSAHTVTDKHAQNCAPTPSLSVCEYSALSMLCGASPSRRDSWHALEIWRRQKRGAAQFFEGCRQKRRARVMCMQTNARPSDEHVHISPLIIIHYYDWPAFRASAIMARRNLSSDCINLAPRLRSPTSLDCGGMRLFVCDRCMN